MEKIKIILLSVLLVGTLSSCSNTDSEKTRGAILPHHLLVDGLMDELYSEISEDNQYERIIIVSPNHYNYGYNYIQTTDQAYKSFEAPELDLAFIEALVDDNSLFVEPFHFEKEHGITSHFMFLEKYFPEAQLVPIIIKNETPKAALDFLIDKITAQDLENTLIVASIDFTHYEAEEVALKDDQRTIDWLENWSGSSDGEVNFNEIIDLAVASTNENDEAVAMDSPESLYVFLELMNDVDSRNFSLWRRTSTASVAKILDPLQNTSHIFAVFSSSINS